MRRMISLLMALLFLSGCAAQETFETVADDPAMYTPDISKVHIDLPEDAKTLTLGTFDTEGVYLCDGYSVTVEILHTGDLAQTIQTVSGYHPDALTVLNTASDGIETYEFVWSAAGENGNQVCRSMVMDDGVYHYAVTVMTDYAQAGALTKAWNDMFASVSLSTD